MSLDKLKRGIMICRIAVIILTILGGIFVFTLVNSDFTANISWSKSVKYIFPICFSIIAICWIYFDSEVKKIKAKQTDGRIKELEKEVSRLKHK